MLAKKELLNIKEQYKSHTFIVKSKICNGNMYKPVQLTANNEKCACACIILEKTNCASMLAYEIN